MALEDFHLKLKKAPKVFRLRLDLVCISYSKDKVGFAATCFRVWRGVNLCGPYSRQGWFVFLYEVP